MSVVHVVLWGSGASSRCATRLAGLAIGAMATSSPAHADDVASSLAAAVPDKSWYSLLNPTPDDEMRKFAPDRPTKGFSVRTVDAGHFELETDIVNYTYSNYQGVITRSFQAFDPTLKLGLTNWMDIEVTVQWVAVFADIRHHVRRGHPEQYGFWRCFPAEQDESVRQ